MPVLPVSPVATPSCPFPATRTPDSGWFERSDKPLIVLVVGTLSTISIHETFSIEGGKARFLYSAYHRLARTAAPQKRVLHEMDPICSLRLNKV